MKSKAEIERETVKGCTHKNSQVASSNTDEATDDGDGGIRHGADVAAGGDISSDW